MAFLMDDSTWQTLVAQVDEAIGTALDAIALLRVNRTDPTVTNAVLDAVATSLTQVQTTVDAMGSMPTTTVVPGVS